MRSKGVSIVDAIKKNAVPEYLSNAIIEAGASCECGEMLEFDASMRRIRCSSEQCKCKIYAEAELALRNLGIDEESIADVRDEIREELREKDAGCWILSSENEEIVKLVNKGESIEFNKILRLTGNKVLGDSSESLVEGYRSLEDFYDDLTKYGVVEIARRLRLDKEISIANVLYSELMRVVKPLMEAESRLTVVVKRIDKVKQAGGGSTDSDKIYTAIQDDTDSISSNFLMNNSSAGELVEKINENRKLKGKDILRLV